jgi:AcrR family transcriptional regulator
MPRPRFEKLTPEKRERILETAAKEFAHHGFDGASLNHILSTAGISKGAAYYYFDDKADLFTTVLQHYWFHLVGHVQLSVEGLDRASFWPKMRELYRQGLNHAYEEPWLLPLMKTLWKSPGAAGGLPAALAGALVPLQEWTMAIVRRGQEVGAVRTDLPKELIFALLFAVDGACDRWCLEHVASVERREIERLSATIFSMMQRMFEPPREGER